MASAPYRWQDDTLILELRVQPRASRDEWVGLHGERFRVRVTAPAVDGRANAHLVEFIAAQFGVPRRAVTLLGGERSRNKRLAVAGPRILPAGVTRAET